MNPEFSPPSSVRNGGRPSLMVGLTIRSIRRSAMPASSARAIVAVSSAMATGSPWKLPLDSTSPASANTSGLSVAAFTSIETTRADVVQRVPAGAVHLRRAAQRVGVLHAAAPAVRFVDLGVVQQRVHVRRRGNLPGMRTQRLDLGRERRARSAHRLDRLRRSQVGDLAPAARPGPAPARRSPVMNWVPLISASPSLAPSTSGSSPTRRSASAPGSSSPPTSASPSPTSGSARCASGARSPLAPSEPRDGTRGCTPAASSASSSSTVSRRTPDAPVASALARSSMAARTTSVGNGSPTPQAWLRSRLSCSRATSSCAIATSTNRPKPVFTP